MATASKQAFRCTKCGSYFESELPGVINVGEHHELKEAVLDGSIFFTECPKCSTRQLVKWPLLYVDPAVRLIVLLSDSPLGLEDSAGYTTRRVERAGDLIEKIKIFDAGLDDRAVELCKYISRQDMGIGNADLRFVRMDGADADLVFTYPSEGKMEMIAVSFASYEDCSAILRRNPDISGSIKGFALVDEAWISSFLA